MSLSKEREEEIRKQLSELFDGMMRTLYSLEGSQFRIEVLAEPKIQKFIDAHAGVLDSTFKRWRCPMPCASDSSGLTTSSPA